MPGSRIKAAADNSVSQREIEHQRLARAIAGESIVLLKNDGTLPIDACAVALFGAGAAATIKGGTGSGEVNERHSVTIWEGMLNAGFSVTTESWLSDYVTELKIAKKKFYKEFFKNSRGLIFGNEDTRINAMSNYFRYPVGREITASDMSGSAEVCVYVIARQAGECADRSLEKYDYNLTGQEIENISKAAAHYKKTILAINVGSSIDLTPIENIDGINAIIYFCQQGMEGGNAFADILTGKTSPSGCLTNTWAKNYDDLPFAREYSYLKGEIGKEYYKEGIYVGYRYFDSFKVEPRYEFGYGLTYSRFSVKCADIYTDGSNITVKARVTNDGEKFSGKKTVQLYVSCPSGKLTREYQSLAAFGKTGLLAPGQSQDDITLSFDLIDLAGYDEAAGAFMLEQGDYILRLGESSRKTNPVGIINLDETVITEKCEKVCPLNIPHEEITPPPISASEEFGNIPRLGMSSADIRTITHDYTEPKPEYSPKVAKWLNELTVDDMIKFVVGTGMSGLSGDSFVPGAAAITTGDFGHLGIASVALCDGPAGVRLLRTSLMQKSGKIKAVDAAMEMLGHTTGIMRRFMFAKPNKGTLMYQYATAFPIGTAIAQTWNTDIFTRFGTAIGTEMTEYGGTYWLAPAMNIQRNPLCGRNYEYFSEDPLLTGKTAQAVTKGVQGFDGCYVTIKHYAANNQEERRNHSDSIISERALREIYLKGYKIVVMGADAKAVMTSYNLLNGVYTPNSYDLCTKLLRGEWGFNGVVMTDWLSTGEFTTDGIMPSNGLAIKNGNDLIMPGGKKYVKRLKADLKNGVVSEDDIRRSCARVLELIASSLPQKELDG
ncbi:MAG: glycoside hydrolase family 3 C-terminal domain-containing protein [Oscillospiraceae bacterium]|nr:glycoside hydrolase family 3 C-terminal domain-containing protein [Oscillospiraceae bacterium]